MARGAAASNLSGMTMRTESTTADVLILGGGVAALEAMMALRELAGDRLRVTLVAADRHFTERPMAVAEPFGRGEPRRIALKRVAADFGAEFVEARAVGVSPREPRIAFADGSSIGADTLILAPGAQARPAFPSAITFALEGSTDAMRALLADMRSGAAKRVAFVVPSLAGWALPLYELALMTARATAGADGVELTFVTPEQGPLAVFGPEPSAAVGKLLAGAGIEFIGDTYADVRDGEVLLRREARALDVERVVSVPRLWGPGLEGIPETPSGFIPVDGHGRVRGRRDVYAAGDAADFPVKQGGLAAQQADAVAQHVANRHGAPVEPARFEPVLRGMLLTGGEPTYVRAGRGGAGDGHASWHPLWWPPTKIAGRRLGPYLAERDMPAPIRPSEGFIDVDIPLTAATLPG
jgi:sulfide:quinone oxidoreductase